LRRNRCLVARHAAALELARFHLAVKVNLLRKIGFEPTLPKQIPNS
jgi:hypothetical protein